MSVWTVAAVVFGLNILLSTAICQAADRDPGSSLGIHFGYFAPFGDWTEHRYAQGVDLFQGDFTFGGELEVQIVSIYAGFFYNYMRLRTGDWENYAQSQGDDLSASASMNEFGVRFKYYFTTDAPNFANLSLGLAGYNLQGNESYGGRTYDYDFLDGGVGITLGSAYKRMLSPRVALDVEVRVFFVIEGVKYADGEVRDVMGAPVTAGLSYHF
jgi:hypothetical protein